MEKWKRIYLYIYIHNKGNLYNQHTNVTNNNMQGKGEKVCKLVDRMELQVKKK
jgi:hypothetical protein